MTDLRNGGCLIRRAKYTRVAERLSQRILAGDYHVQGLPAERDLAVEVGVSHMTARKAIQKLLHDGLLRRLANGRLEVYSDATVKGKNAAFQVALLAPAWESNEVSRWHIAMTQLSQRFNCAFRLVYYAHWDDPIIRNSIDRFDGVFLMPFPAPMPPEFLDNFHAKHKRVAILGSDWSDRGFPCLRLFSAVFVQKVLNHLMAQGHKRIGYFNVQPIDQVITGYMTQWRVWTAAKGVSGPFIDEPVKPFTDTLVVAHEIISRKLSEGGLDCTALLCTQERSAAGAMRALVDHGMWPGRELAICTIDGASRAQYNVPSLTSLETPDPKPYLAACLEWMLARDDSPWHGPLLLEPQDVPLAVRESTASQKMPTFS